MPRRQVKARPGPYLLRLDLLRERIPNPEAYPYCLPAIRSLGRLAFHPKVTFFVGENGSGKSTLLEAIAVGLGMNPEGGGRHFNFATRESHSGLYDAFRFGYSSASRSTEYFLRAESFYNVATVIERLGVLGAYENQSLHEQSHGESFFHLFRSRFKPNGLYLMDEPEAALSPQRQLQFLSILHDFCTNGCQFIIATHSPIIMAYPNAIIYHFGNDGLREVPYTETEHYRVTQAFLANPKKSLAILCPTDGEANDPDQH